MSLKTPIVIENGSGFIKVGFAGEDAPRLTESRKAYDGRKPSYASLAIFTYQKFLSILDQ